MDDRLESWVDLKKMEWPNLLLGNGFSINIHRGFSYSSLVDESDLPDEAKDLFDAVGTTDFETVMRVLATARAAARALSFDEDGFQRVYDAFRGALIEAVRAVHVQHARVPMGVLEYVGQHLAEYDRVFTTNYDLLPYWATMDAGDRGHPRLRDAFGPDESGRLYWQRGFHDDDGARSIYYLHGALHLIANIYTGRVRKVRAGSGALLEAVIGQWSRDDVTVLFVSEGDSEQKRTAIEASEYLRACYERLRNAEGGFVILGQGLNSADKHVTKAICEGDRSLAIGLHGTDTEIGAQIERLEGELTANEVRFFRSAEHPLAIPELRRKPKSGIWFPPRA